jgi:murein DD-endopeptidase MepM/ murein hydrolase activator NlpD
VIAASGNTGHSFAPHLHYQMMSTANDRVLDPFEQHKTVRKTLAADSRPEFDGEVRRLESLMGPKVAR